MTGSLYSGHWKTILKYFWKDFVCTVWACRALYIIHERLSFISKYCDSTCFSLTIKNMEIIQLIWCLKWFKKSCHFNPTDWIYSQLLKCEVWFVSVYWDLTLASSLKFWKWGANLIVFFCWVSRRNFLSCWSLG